MNPRTVNTAERFERTYFVRCSKRGKGKLAAKIRKHANCYFRLNFHEGGRRNAELEFVMAPTAESKGSIWCIN